MNASFGRNGKYKLALCIWLVRIGELEKMQVLYSVRQQFGCIRKLSTCSRLQVLHTTLLQSRNLRAATAYVVSA